MKQPLHVAGIGLSVLASLFLLISIATTGWLSDKRGSYGLFRTCLKILKGCASYAPTGSEAAVRFFVVVGFLLTLTSLIVSIMYFIKFIQKDIPNRMLPLVAALELFLAGACVILGCIIFAAKVKKDYELTPGIPKDIGYSFGLAIVGAVLCFASGALVLVQRNKGGDAA